MDQDNSLPGETAGQQAIRDELQTWLDQVTIEGQVSDLLVVIRQQANTIKSGDTSEHPAVLRLLANVQTLATITSHEPGDGVA